MPKSARVPAKTAVLTLASFENEMGAMDGPVTDLGIQQRKASLIWTFVIVN